MGPTVKTVADDAILDARSLGSFDEAENGEDYQKSQKVSPEASISDVQMVLQVTATEW